MTAKKSPLLDPALAAAYRPLEASDAAGESLGETGSANSTEALLAAHREMFTPELAAIQSLPEVTPFRHRIDLDALAKDIDGLDKDDKIVSATVREGEGMSVISFVVEKPSGRHAKGATAYDKKYVMDASDIPLRPAAADAADEAAKAEGKPPVKRAPRKRTSTAKSKS